MKKVLIFFSLSIFTFLSCRKNSQVLSNEELLKTGRGKDRVAEGNFKGLKFEPTVENLSNYVGKCHNEFQAKAFLAIQKSLNKNNYTATNSLATEFTDENFYQVRDEMHPIMTEMLEPFGVTSSSDLNLQDMDLIPQSQLLPSMPVFSSDAQMIIFEMNQAVQSLSNFSNNSFVYQCTLLKNRAMNLPNINEALILSSTLQTSISSYEYWSQNFNNWTNLIIQETVVQKVGTVHTPNRVIGADALGAYGAAMAGAAAGPPGIIAGGLLGGSYASATEALLQVMETSDNGIAKSLKYLRSFF